MTRRKNGFAPRALLRSEAGQSLVEFIGTFALMLGTSLGFGLLIDTQWNRLRCAYLTFEAAHAVRIGARLPRFARNVNVRFEGEHVRATLRCGKVEEATHLPARPETVARTEQSLLAR